ncbi:MAG: hypothetical protein ABI172_05765 [Ginsengibacter sp.]
MKKFIISALLLAGTFGFVNAQAVKKTHPQKSVVATTQSKTVTKTSTQAPVVKMKPVKSSSAVTKSSVSSTSSVAHLKSNGTPDKRFKENKSVTTTTKGPLKKNGTADMRYKANKK